MMGGLAALHQLTGQMYAGSTPQQRGLLNSTGILPFFNSQAVGNTIASGGAGGAPSGGSFAQRLGQMAVNGAGADQRRRAAQFPQTGLRATLASGGASPTYGGTTLGGGR